MVGVGGKTVHRQIVSVGDPDTFGQEAAVNAGGELSVKDANPLPAGTNNIGDIDVLTIAAGANRIGKVTIRDSADAADINPLAEATFTGRINTQGQKTMAASTPVVVSSDQSVIPVSDNAGSLTVDGSVSISGTPTVDVTDDATRDNGKIDIALLDQYTPQDVDTGAPVVNALPIVLKKTASGAPDFGTSTDPIRTDPTGTTTQPISGTVSVTEPVSVDDNAGSLTVDQATATNLKAEVVGPTADNAANPTAKLSVLPVKANAAAPTFTEGNVNPLSTDLSGRLRTDTSTWIGSTAPTVGSKTSANSIPVVVASDQGNVPVSQATATNLNAQVVGDIADASADSGKPIKISGVGRTTNRAAVTDGQRVNLSADDLGRLVVIMDQVRDLVNDQTTTISTTIETTVFTAVASVFNDLVMLTVANISATATRIDFRDTTAGSVRFSLYCPAGATIGFVPKVPLKQTTVNTNWTAQLGTAVTDVRIFVQVVRNV